MKKRGIYDILKTTSEDYQMLRELAEKLREKKPESAGFLDEASYHLSECYVALQNYLDSM